LKARNSSPLNNRRARVGSACRAGLYHCLVTLSHTAHTGVDSFLDCAFRAGSSSVFLNSLLGKHLIDCIALASFTHSPTQVPGAVHYFWPKNGHSEKVPCLVFRTGRKFSEYRGFTAHQLWAYARAWLHPSDYRRRRGQVGRVQKRLCRTWSARPRSVALSARGNTPRIGRVTR
jgi:hypothetical protein